MLFSKSNNLLAGYNLLENVNVYIVYVLIQGRTN
jgi:hypothetical protein